MVDKPLIQTLRKYWNQDKRQAVRSYLNNIQNVSFQTPLSIIYRKDKDSSAIIVIRTHDFKISIYLDHGYGYINRISSSKIPYTEEIYFDEEYTDYLYIYSLANMFTKTGLVRRFEYKSLECPILLTLSSILIYQYIDLSVHLCIFFNGVMFHFDNNSCNNYAQTSTKIHPKHFGTMLETIQMMREYCQQHHRNEEDHNSLCIKDILAFHSLDGIGLTLIDETYK